MPASRYRSSGVSNYLAKVEAKADAAINRSPAVRAAYYSFVFGGTLVVSAIILSSRTFVCREECIRVSQTTLDSLIRCEDSCETLNGYRLKSTKECEKSCVALAGTTRRQINRVARKCDTDCVHLAKTISIVSFVGCVVLLAVVPSLSFYTGACQWNCCQGEAASSRVFMYVLGWAAYGCTLFLLQPALVEEAHEVGGKFLFVFGQIVAMYSMLMSRIFSQPRDPASANRRGSGGGSVGAPTAVTGGGQRPIGSTDGGGGSEQAVRELQREVKIMQEQVRDLVKIKMAQLQAAKANQGAAAAAARMPAAVNVRTAASAPNGSSSGGAADLMM